MKKNEDENKKFIKETLAKSKTLTRSANLFLQQNNLNNNNNNNDNNPKSHKIRTSRIRKDIYQQKKSEKR